MEQERDLGQDEHGSTTVPLNNVIFSHILDESIMGAAQDREIH